MISRNRFWVLLCGMLFAVAGSLLVRDVLGAPSTGIDDADIFFVYARNLCEGHGFVYNITGSPVEGFTSLLWTLICAAHYCLFFHLEVPLGIFLVIVGGGCVYSCLRRTEQQGVFLLLLASVPGWFAWCQVSLMETGFWCLIITLLGVAVAERRALAVTVLLPLMVLTRPESMLWGGWTVLLVFGFAEPGRRLKSALVPGISYVITMVLLIGFRLHYFGYPVPNTYYAKVSESLISNIVSGLSYFAGYIFSGPAVFGVFLMLSIMGARAVYCGRCRWSFSSRVAAFLLPGIGIPILVGGDHFGAYRFYQPLWPLLCLIAAIEWPRFREHCRPRLIAVSLCLTVAGGWALFPYYGKLDHEFRIASEGRANGAALVRMFSDLKSLPTVAVITAGGNKFSYPGHVYDLMGLNSTEMAHAPGNRGGYKNHTGFNRDVFYRWAPDILLCGDSEEFDSLVLNGLHEDAQFRINYLKCTLHRNGAELNAWFRNDFLMSLPGSGVPVVPGH